MLWGCAVVVVLYTLMTFAIATAINWRLPAFTRESLSFSLCMASVICMPLYVCVMSSVSQIRVGAATMRYFFDEYWIKSVELEQHDWLFHILKSVALGGSDIVFFAVLPGGNPYATMLFSTLVVLFHLMQWDCEQSNRHQAKARRLGEESDKDKGTSSSPMNRGFLPMVLLMLILQTWLSLRCWKLPLTMRFNAQYTALWVSFLANCALVYSTLFYYVGAPTCRTLLLEPFCEFWKNLLPLERIPAGVTAPFRASLLPIRNAVSLLVVHVAMVSTLAVVYWSAPVA